MKQLFVGALLLMVLLVPGRILFADTVSSASASATLETELRALLVQLQEKLAVLLAQAATKGLSVTATTSVAYDVDDVTKITYQEVYSDTRDAVYRYEVTLGSGQKLVVSHLKSAKESGKLLAFKNSGFIGSDVDELLDEARRLSGLPWKTCSITLDKDSYAVNEPIVLSWSTDESYVAFNAYGSSNKKAYIDDSFRESEGSVTIKIDTAGRHDIHLNVYPWKERFASGSCTISFEVGDLEDGEESHDAPDDPELEYFTVEPSTAVKKSDSLTIRFGVAQSSKCGVFAESGANTTTVLAKAANKSLKISNVAVPEWVSAGTSFEYVLRCDSYSNAYYPSQVDALVESVVVTVAP